MRDIDPLRELVDAQATLTGVDAQEAHHFVALAV
jgi:hypothetical protein